MKKQGFSPSPKIYAINPTALERELATDDQVRWDEDTLRWGKFDDLPLRIMNAVNDSPTAIRCLEVYEQFLAGSGFTDEGLMSMPIDKDGTTLFDFHCKLASYITYLDSFSVNFKFDQKGRITNSYVVGVECNRFVKPLKKDIEFIKFNPYWGTSQFTPDMTQTYPVFDISKAKEQISTALDGGKEYLGQMYFYGSVRPPYKFYSVPKYWSGEKWIYVDANIQTFHKENLDNGFFQSALINVIGDPNQFSKNPKYQEVITLTDGTTKKVENKKVTLAMEFDEQMRTIFSGAKKAGTAMVLWSQNESQAVKVSSFPVNSQFDVLRGTFEDTIKGICVATGIDPILLAIQGGGLVNSGDSIRAVIENMQSKVSRHQRFLETFYNIVMFPNMQKAPKEIVKIKNYSPISLSVTVDEKFWSVLTDAEKKEFVKKNVPGMQEIIKDEVLVDEDGEPLTPEEEILSDNLKDLNMRQIYRLNKISQQFAKGDINEGQAVILIKGFGFSDAEARAWLGLPMEEAKV